MWWFAVSTLKPRSGPVRPRSGAGRPRRAGRLSTASRGLCTGRAQCAISNRCAVSGRARRPGAAGAPSRPAAPGPNSAGPTPQPGDLRTRLLRHLASHRSVRRRRRPDSPRQAAVRARIAGDMAVSRPCKAPNDPGQAHLAENGGATHPHKPQVSGRAEHAASWMTSGSGWRCGAFGFANANARPTSPVALACREPRSVASSMVLRRRSPLRRFVGSARRSRCGSSSRSGPVAPISIA